MRADRSPATGESVATPAPQLRLGEWRGAATKAIMLIVLALFAASDAAGAFKSDLRTCGVDQSRAIDDNEDDPENREVGVAGSSPVSDGQLSCLAAAAAKGAYFIEFADPNLNARFTKIAAARMAEAGRKMGRDWLAGHGLLGQLPSYEPGRETLGSYVGRLERLCGAAPGSALTVDSPKTIRLSFRPGDVQTAQCIPMALAASNLAQHGVIYGFIGNDVAQP